jgi:lipoprotein signal peptidase
VHRTAIVLSLALPLAAADLVWKHLAATPAWAYHPRGAGWLALCVALMAAALAAARFSSLIVAVAAGVMVGGVLGNVLSAAWNGLAVPDPIIVFSPHAVIAFNLADVFASTGILMLTGVLATALIRNRHVLSTRQEARAALQRSSRGRR